MSHKLFLFMKMFSLTKINRLQIFNPSTQLHTWIFFFWLPSCTPLDDPNTSHEQSNTPSTIPPNMTSNWNTTLPPNVPFLNHQTITQSLCKDLPKRTRNAPSYLKDYYCSIAALPPSNSSPTPGTRYLKSSRRGWTGDMLIYTKIKNLSTIILHKDMNT